MSLVTCASLGIEAWLRKQFRNSIISFSATSTVARAFLSLCAMFTLFFPFVEGMRRKGACQSLALRILFAGYCWPHLLLPCSHTLHKFLVELT